MVEILHKLGGEINNQRRERKIRRYADTQTYVHIHMHMRKSTLRQTHIKGVGDFHQLSKVTYLFYQQHKVHI